jgi:membrane-bound lytic murein transglycosylase B
VGGAWLQRVAALLLASAASAAVADYSQHELAGPFIETMVQQHGFDRGQVTAWLRQAERRQSILDAISRPAEKAKPWRDYRRIFITADRVAKGVQFWGENRAALERAERETGVPASVIVGIIGVETYYGRNTGSHRVLDALATLGFDYPPRADFFRKQLEEYLLLVRETGLPIDQVKGSYAGAMGLGQFIPSSYRNFAVDFDGDGRVDLLGSRDDAIGSIANYLKVHGWRAGAPTATPAVVTRPQAVTLTTGLQPDQTLAALVQQGVRPTGDWPGSARVGLIRLDGDNGDEYWLGGENFYVVTTYNRSPMYALAVLQLSEAVAAARRR